MITIEKLTEYGADTAPGLSRCMNNEGLYLRLVGKVLEDTNFEALEKALSAGNLDAGFEAAHALKGVLGNLSITPLYDKVCAVTELLRSRTEMDYSGAVAEILSDLEKLKAM